MVDDNRIEWSGPRFQLQAEILDGAGQRRRVVGSADQPRTGILNGEAQGEIVGSGEPGFIKDLPVGVAGS